MSKRKSLNGGGNRGGGRGGRRRVRFQRPNEEEEEDSDVGTPARIGGGNEDEDEDDDVGIPGSRRAGKSSSGGGALGGGFEDDDEDDDANVERMVSNVEGEEEEEPEYEKHNEAGDPVEPFNLRTERDLGYFDTNGNFVWKKQNEEPDAWLAEMDEGAMEEAIGAASKRATANDLVAANPDPLSLMGIGELRDALLVLLQPGESVIKALQRLGGKKSEGGGGQGWNKGHRSWGKKKTQATKAGAGEAQSNGVGDTKEGVTQDGGSNSGGGREGASQGESNGGEVQGQESGDGKEGTGGQKEAFERVTDLADALLQAGQHDVYQQTREDFEESANAAREADIALGAGPYFSSAHSGTGGEQTGLWGGGRDGEGAGERGSMEDSVMFEYRGIDGNIHGPFGMEQMHAWTKAGYFDGDQAVMMRQIGGLKGKEHQDSAVPGEGTGGSSGGVDGGEGTLLSSADLIADLDDNDDEEENSLDRMTPDKTKVVGEARDGSGESSVEAEGWIRSDKIDWSAF